MLYRLRDLPAMLATPVGRLQVLGSIRHRLWPLAWRVAWMHRRTTARHARIVVVVGSLGKSTTREPSPALSAWRLTTTCCSMR
jgi:hypothetical protein